MVVHGWICEKLGWLMDGLLNKGWVVVELVYTEELVHSFIDWWIKSRLETEVV